MNKKIKIIDLLNKIANGEEVPEKIKWRDKIWDYWEGDQDYKSKQGRWFTSNLNDIRTKEFVNDTVEIIEQEPEIDIQSYKELLLNQLREREHTNADIYMLGIQINALIRAVKQIDSQIKNKGVN